MNRKTIFASILFFIFPFVSLGAGPAPAATGEEELFSGSAPPNVLIILDNSNSMDEDFFGNAVGSWAAGSKSVEGKKVLIDLVNTYADSMRLGLMTYKLPGDMVKRYLANAFYFSSYDPRSYCPSPPDACVEYCRTGTETGRLACQEACQVQNPLFDATYIDDSITDFSKAADPTAARNKYCGLVYPKTNRMVNPSDLSNYIYYKQPLPFYPTSPEPASAFWASPDYIADDIGDTANYYYKFSGKTGTSDGIPTDTVTPDNGYSGYFESEGVVPTESDFGLGYKDFGKRQASFGAGRTFFSNTSPSGCGCEDCLHNCGYLHIPVADNDSGNVQRNLLLSKLKTYENDEAGYMSCMNADLNQCDYIVNAGLTPTAGTLDSAIDYFQGKYTPGTDIPSVSTPIPKSAAPCQANFIIYVTDGLPTANESGVPGTSESLMQGVIDRIGRLRNLAVNVEGSPYNYDIRTYVVGLGLTSEAKAKLDEMAVHGGTDLDGHAYYADSPEQLKETLGQVFTRIQTGTYSFSLPSVSSLRFEDENHIYVSSFEPEKSENNEPFWKGHLKKISILSDGPGEGGLGGTIWDAADVLGSSSASARNMKTLIGRDMKDFKKDNITPEDLGLNSKDVVTRDLIVDYIRGENSLTTASGTVVLNLDSNRKLGDIFHSNPVGIGTPNPFFRDVQDKGKAFESFRGSNERTSDNNKRIVVVGANDGQLHAFESGTGDEAWSFIPPNLLPKLRNIAHSDHSTSHLHTFYVDGPISAADVWSGNDGTQKNAGEWKTLLVFGEGIGVRGMSGNPDYLWSKKASCDRDFGSDPTKGHDNYCGYYALNVTDTLNLTSGQFLWTLDPNKKQSTYLGEPWSRMVFGRVMIKGKEKWVGFVGGGYTQGTPAAGKAGKGFFVVDLKDGDILWAYTLKNNDKMDYIPGSPAIFDRDNDGFIDTAYVGDLAGNVWKFSFCRFNPDEEEAQKCDESKWTGELLFDPGTTKTPIFTTPVVARGIKGEAWLFWGTGDRVHPNQDRAQNSFFALRDSDLGVTYAQVNLQEISSSVFDIKGPSNQGWYIKLTGQERILSDATIFRGIVFFTSYTPPSGENLCGATGTAALYGVAMMPVAISGSLYESGKGVFSELGQRKVELGPGIPSSPVISLRPIDGAVKGANAPDLYVTVSGGAGKAAELKSSSGIEEVSKALEGSGPSTNILHWKDRRIRANP